VKDDGTEVWRIFRPNGPFHMTVESKPLWVHPGRLRGAEQLREMRRGVDLSEGAVPRGLAVHGLLRKGQGRAV